MLRLTLAGLLLVAALVAAPAAASHDPLTVPGRAYAEGVRWNFTDTGTYRATGDGETNEGGVVIRETFDLSATLAWTGRANVKTIQALAGKPNITTFEADDLFPSEWTWTSDATMRWEVTATGPGIAERRLAVCTLQATGTEPLRITGTWEDEGLRGDLTLIMLGDPTRATTTWPSCTVTATAAFSSPSGPPPVAGPPLPFTTAAFSAMYVYERGGFTADFARRSGYENATLGLRPAGPYPDARLGNAGMFDRAALRQYVPMPFLTPLGYDQPGIFFAGSGGEPWLLDSALRPPATCPTFAPQFVQTWTGTCSWVTDLEVTSPPFLCRVATARHAAHAAALDAADAARPTGGNEAAVLAWNDARRSAVADFIASLRDVVFSGCDPSDGEMNDAFARVASSERSFLEAMREAHLMHGTTAAGQAAYAAGARRFAVLGGQGAFANSPFLPPASAATGGWVTVSVHSPVALHAYDSSGRHVGWNATTGAPDTFGEAAYSGSPGTAQTLTLPHGEWRVEVEEIGPGNYTLETRFGRVNESLTFVARPGRLLVAPWVADGEGFAPLPLWRGLASERPRLAMPPWPNASVSPPAVDPPAGSNDPPLGGDPGPDGSADPPVGGGPGDPLAGTSGGAPGTNASPARDGAGAIPAPGALVLAALGALAALRRRRR